MLINDIIWPKHRRYKSKTPYEPIDFFLECLCNSTHFDLALGFFSSSAIRILSCGFATFLYNGGKMRLIINNILSEKDKSVLIESVNLNKEIHFDLNNIIAIKETLSSHNQHFFNCLSWLIVHNKIDIIIVEPKDRTGISHTKEGLFNDGVNEVAFNGSCNFTQTALIANIESIDAFCSWDGEVMAEKINNTKKLFNKTFNKEDSSVNYLDPTKVVCDIRDIFGVKGLSQLLKEEKELLEQELSNTNNQSPKLRTALKKALLKAENAVQEIKEKEEQKEKTPHFPYPQGPRDYQKIAYEKWVQNNCQGLFAMATGTGKTITSLNCVLLESQKKSDIYQAVILVPTIALVNQWQKECIKFNFQNIITVSSKTQWKESLFALQTLSTLGVEKSFIIICTYASFVKRRFQEEFENLSLNTIFIADECHNLGAPSILKKLNTIKLVKKIGLSATPNRQFEEDVNGTIRHFFNERSDEEYTYEYDMYKAIHEEPSALCHFRYYPHIVNLTDEEFEEYKDLSLKIARFPEKKNKEQKELFDMLCIKRQRIIHKAHNKIDVFTQILNEEYQQKGNNLKYTLIYTPEGIEYFDPSRTDNIIEEDTHLIDLYTRIVASTGTKVSVKQFTGDSLSQDRIAMLNDFSTGKLQVLTSMKCLDEGVDVPRAETAIFCSSTGNPRQFIQRRGRVLRKHDDKQEATIHDLIVVPSISCDPSLYELERNEISKELNRVRDFAELSENHYYSLRILEPYIDYYNLNF